MANPWWSSKTVAIVSGSCTGIGLEIVKQFAHRGITTVLTGRSHDKIIKATNLMEQQGLHVLSHVLDVTDPVSIQEFASWVKNELGGLDILVNNAGAMDAQNHRLVLQTNYYGSRQLTEAMLPLFSPSAAGSRIVMISASSSRLDMLQGETYAEWVPKLADEAELNEQVINSFIQSFSRDKEEGKHIDKGWPTLETVNPPDSITNYAVSKMALNAYTRMLARDIFKKRLDHNIYVNCMCPGLTATAMTSNLGHSVEMGVDTAVWLALLPEVECQSGKFFVDRKEVGFLQIPLFQNGQLTYPIADYRRRLIEWIHST